ncbi:MAG: protein kinase [Acidobacteria bacterium]|nr:protein kinase [Acidobacteriota bacterium]
MESLTPQQYARLRELFDQALAMEESRRRAWLESLPEEDSALAPMLGELIASHEQEDEQVPVSVVSPGEMLGPYRLERLLGQGGMGSVFLATREDGAFRKQVALKVMRFAAGSSAFQSRFARERQILASLDHPSIGRILDGGTSASGIPYLVMEYVDGLPIDRYCEQEKPSIEERIRMFLHVCAAVQFAHQKLIVHRDLKPGNILVEKSGQPKLLDFGVSKALESGETAGGETIAFGTPRYASPEQLRGAPPSTAADVYSLGVILYELLTGKWPYGREPAGLLETVDIISSEEPLAPSEIARRTGDGRLCRKLRGDLDHILTKAVERQAPERYASAEELRLDLERYLDGKPVLARGNALAYRARKFVHRNKAAFAVVALLTVSLAGGIYSTMRQARIAVQQAAEAQRQRSNAEARAADLHDLARSLLFELHDGIRHLAGATPARQVLLEKTRGYLEALARQAAGNAALQEELAEVYDRMGDLESTMYLAGKNPNALRTFREALTIREGLAKMQPDEPRHARGVVYARMKLGDGYWSAGDTNQAVDWFRRALREAAVVAPADAKLAGMATHRLCNLLPSIGKTAEAIEVCRESLLHAEPYYAAHKSDRDVEYLLVLTHSNLGNVLRLQGKIEDSLTHFRRSMELCKDLVQAQPANALARAAAGTTGIYAAAALERLRDFQAAAPAYAEAIAAMKASHEIDASDLRVAKTLAFALARQAQGLVSMGDRAGAEKAMADSLRLHKELVERPGSTLGEWNEYADALNKNPFPALGNPQEALQYALKAVQASQEKNPFCLDTLAWAYFRSGNVGAAVETSRKALKLLPPAGALYNEILAGSKQFEAALKK